MSEQNPDIHRVSPLRSVVAGVIGLASITAPALSAIEGANDVPELRDRAEEATYTASHIENRFNGLVWDVEYGVDLDFKYDKETDKLNINIRRDDDITLETFERSFDQLKDTEKDVDRTSWQAIGGAIGLLVSAGMSRADRSLRKGGGTRETAKGISSESRSLFAGLLLASGLASGILLSTGHTQDTLNELQKVDLDRLTTASESIKADIDKLDVSIIHTADRTQISLRPDLKVISEIEAKARSLGVMTPELEKSDIAADGLITSVAALAMIGLAGTTINTISAVKKSRYERRRIDEYNSQQISRASPYYDSRPIVTQQRAYFSRRK